MWANVRLTVRSVAQLSTPHCVSEAAQCWCLNYFLARSATGKKKQTTTTATKTTTTAKTTTTTTTKTTTTNNQRE